MNIINHKMLEGCMSDTPSDALIRLIYISKVNTNKMSVFKHIKTHSESFNRGNNIRGFLCNNEESFLQCLEGSKGIVFSLMQRIFQDVNHKEVDVIFAEKVGGYSFLDWRMHSLYLNDSNWEKISNHTQLSDISPFKPETWPNWFVEHFIECVKIVNYSNIDEDFDHITFDTLGYSEVEKKLANDGLFFYIFLGLLICSIVAILLFKYDVVS